MKRVILIILLFVLSFEIVRAQNSPIVLYSGSVNIMTQFYSDNCIFKDSTGGPNAPYEGTSQLVFDYDFDNYYAGAGYAINNWWYHDFTGHTHLQCAVRGTANNSNTNLIFIMEDTNGVAGADAIILNNANTPNYQVVSIPLSNFVGATPPKSTIDMGAIKVMRIVAGNTEVSAGSYFIDDIKVVDNGTTATMDKQVSWEVTVHPNPSSGKYFIYSAEPIDYVTVKDYLGNVILSEEGLVQFDLSNHPDALYFVTLSSKGKIMTKKLIKDK